MRNMGRLGESTLEEMEKQTQREVQQRSGVDSPMLPRLTASLAAPARTAARDERLLAVPGRDYVMQPACISVSRLSAQVEQQASPSALGGVGFSHFDDSQSAWRSYLNRTARSAAFAFVDLYSEEEVAAPEAQPSPRGARKQHNPFFQESGLPAPPLPAGAGPTVSPRSPRTKGERSGSVWEQEVKGEGARLAVTTLQGRAAEKLLLAGPRVAPLAALLPCEIQLQQLAREGRCFHVLLLVEEEKQLVMQQEGRKYVSSDLCALRSRCLLSRRTSGATRWRASPRGCGWRSRAVRRCSGCSRAPSTPVPAACGCGARPGVVGRRAAAPFCSSIWWRRIPSCTARPAQN
jgi:hypothetical protein